MTAEIRSVPKQLAAAPGTDATALAAPGFSPFLLERLYFRLGQPFWFWPCVMALLFVLIVAGSSCSPEMEVAV